MEPGMVIAGWELPKIAAPLLGGVLKQGGDRLIQSLNPTDIKKAIESAEKAIKKWEKTLAPPDLLFYSAKPDGWNGFNKFLSEYFDTAFPLAMRYSFRSPLPPLRRGESSKSPFLRGI